VRPDSIGDWLPGLKKPGYETRVAILQKKARIARPSTLPEDVVCYIAGKVGQQQPASLKGAITKIQGLASLQNGQLDPGPRANSRSR